MSTRSRRTSLCVVLLATAASLMGCAAAPTAGGSRPEPRLLRDARTPEPIYAHNLSLDDEWADDARTDYLPVLEGVVDVARRAGYRRVMLARALPRKQWVHRKGAEPLEQFTPLSEARRRALARI